MGGVGGGLRKQKKQTEEPNSDTQRDPEPATLVRGQCSPLHHRVTRQWIQRPGEA